MNEQRLVEIEDQHDGCEGYADTMELVAEVRTQRAMLDKLLAAIRVSASEFEFAGDEDEQEEALAHITNAATEVLSELEARDEA